MAPESNSLDILRRFIMVTGKGGVGKSTLTAALALMSARRGERTLVCELNTHERVSKLLGHSPVGHTVSRLEDNLWSVNIDPEKAMQEYGLMKLRFHAFYRLVFENPLVGALVRFIPGINDLVMLGKAFNHERETNGDGGQTWDRIIIDAPATGHGLTFFRLPKIIMDAVPSGNMHAESAEMWRLISDPDRTAIHLVALPEDLPVQETLELHQRLTEELGLPVSTIFLNQCPVSPVSEALEDTISRWNQPPSNVALSTLWSAIRVRLDFVGQARRHRQNLGTLGQPIIDLPIRYSSPFGRADIEALASAIEQASHAG